MRGQGFGNLRGGQRIGYGRLAESGDGDDVAGFSAVHRLTLQSAERQYLRHPAGLDEIAIAADSIDQ